MRPPRGLFHNERVAYPAEVSRLSNPETNSVVDLIRTARTQLREAQPDDAQELLPIWTDFQVTQFTLVRNITSVEDCRLRLGACRA